MSHPYTPVKAHIISGSIRTEREQQYDPERLKELSGALLGLADYIENFAYAYCDPRECRSTEKSTFVAYDFQAEEMEDPDTSDSLYTALEIDQISANTPCRVAERYVIRLWQWSDTHDEEDQVKTEYRLSRATDGTATLRVYTSMDGVAEALRHDDPVFLRAVKWRDVTEYEARQLYTDLEHFTESSRNTPGKDKVI